MYRKALAELLRSEPMTVHQLAQLLECPTHEVLDDLRHLQHSLRHRPGQLKVQPAKCRKCGFVFSPEKLSKPGKCPRCRGTWIREPLISLVLPGEK